MRLLTLCWALLAFWPISAKAQTVVETNNTTCCLPAADNRAPFRTVTGGQRYIHAYSKADFNNQISGSVTIDRLAYHVGGLPNPAPFTVQNVTLRMKEYAATSLCPGVSGTTTVFTGNVTFSSIGWLDFDLVPDFTWTNVDANYLWVEVCYTDPSPTGVSGPQFSSFSGTSTCRQHQSDLHSGGAPNAWGCATTALNASAQTTKASVRLTLAGNPPCAAPTTQASSLSFSNIAQTSASVNWTNGNGGGRVVYINTTNSFTPPANGSNPTASTTYAGGQQCIFNGTGSGPVNVTGLAASTQYFVRVYEYCSPERNFNTTTASANPNDFTTLTAVCTAPTTQASSLSFSNIAQTSTSVNWTNGNGGGRVVYINTTNSFTPPANGSNPTASTAYAGGQQCIFNGTGGGPVNVTGLAASTQYFVRVYEYCSPERNYNTTTASANPNDFTTSSAQQTCAAPTTQASSLSFSNIAQTSVSVNWTNGNGGGRVVYINTTNSFTPPANGSNLTASTVYAGGQQCIFNGTGGGPVNVTGLAASTQYFVQVFEYCLPDYQYATGTGNGNPGTFSTTLPTLTTLPTQLDTLQYIVGMGPSASRTYVLSGSDLVGSGNISVQAASELEISTDNVSFLGSLSLPFASGQLIGQPVTLFVRLRAGLPVGLYPGLTIAQAGGGAANSVVTTTGEVKSTTMGIDNHGNTLCQLFPNPAQWQVQIQCTSMMSDKVNYRLLAIDGRLVQEGQLIFSGDKGWLNRGEIPSGVYFLDVQFNQGQHEHFKVVWQD